MGIKDLKELSEIALDESQAVLSGFTKATCHRWTFVMRTIEIQKISSSHLRNVSLTHLSRRS